MASVDAKAAAPGANVAASLAASAAMAILGVDASSSTAASKETLAGGASVDSGGDAGLFDYAAYSGSTGPTEGMSSASETTRAAATASASATQGLFAQVLDGAPGSQERGSEKHGDGADEKKMGRPSHPAWEHFARGEKRNRFHHNAYCKYCTANGVDPPPVRGVSGNMIRHLQKCIYCPTEIVTQLKLLCAQKDAASFNKRHHATSRDVDLLLQDAAPIAKKKRKQQLEAIAAPDLRSVAPRLSSDAALAMAAAAGQRTQGSIVEEFMPLQLPLLSPDLGVSSGASTTPVSATMVASPALGPDVATKVIDVSCKSGSEPGGAPASSTKARVHGGPKKAAKSEGTRSRHRDPRGKTDPRVMNELVLKASAVSALPWDWICVEESAQLLREVGGEVNMPHLSKLVSLGSLSHDKQMAQMRDEAIGVTLSVNLWATRYPKSTVMLFSLVDAAGKSDAWDLVDVGIEYSQDLVTEKIVECLSQLQEKGIHVINVVTDSFATYRAARSAVGSISWADHSLSVLPCFSHVLQLLLGVVLTSSETLTETMGDVIELVQMFSNHRVLTVLRRECGDSDAALTVPTTQSWYSFIDCVDSVRQYEDMIKIVAAKVLKASTCSDAGSGEGTRSKSPQQRLRKDSAGNTVDELAESGLSASVIRSIQSHGFWERVVSLSELMSPIKESFKIMNSKTVAGFSLSDVFYQLGRMHQQYGAIISDWDENASAGRSVEHVTLLQQTVNNSWKLYDQPLMILGYVFNYNLHDTYLDRQHSPLQWLAVAKTAKECFRRWFCAASSTRNPSRMLGLSDEAVAQFFEDLLTFKERKYPFDSESVCDFENPKVFYMLISDSHPLMHMFGARLFSFVTSTPPLVDVVAGKHFLSSVPSTVNPPGSILPVLQMILPSSTKPSTMKDAALHYSGSLSNFKPISDKPSGLGLQDDSSAFPSSLSRMSTGKTPNMDGETQTSVKIWSKSQWTRLAGEWKAHCGEETKQGQAAIDHAVTMHSSAADPSAIMPLVQVFKEKLPSRLPQDREDAVVDV